MIQARLTEEDFDLVRRNAANVGLTIKDGKTQMLCFSTLKDGTRGQKRDPEHR